MADQYEDGNALAGPLGEIFAVDLTSAITWCTTCGRTGALAELHVYRFAPGLVARCAGCGAVVLRIVRGPDAVWLDMTGTVNVKIPLEA
jgi:hypothetical protein